MTKMNIKNMRELSTHNKELAVDVLMDNPPRAGADVFDENIEKYWNLGYL